MNGHRKSRARRRVTKPATNGVATDSDPKVTDFFKPCSKVQRDSSSADAPVNGDAGCADYIAQISDNLDCILLKPAEPNGPVFKIKILPPKTNGVKSPDRPVDNCRHKSRSEDAENCFVTRSRSGSIGVTTRNGHLRNSSQQRTLSPLQPHSPQGDKISISSPIGRLRISNGMSPLAMSTVNSDVQSSGHKQPHEIIYNKEQIQPSKPKARRKLIEPQEHNRLVTDYFPIRKSERRCLSKIKKEKQNEVAEAILSDKEEGLRVFNSKEKGRCVMADRLFKKNEFVVEYSGDLVDFTEAKKREKMYEKDRNAGCYMYYFHFNDRAYCVDATAETGKLGRLINHSRTSSNLTTKTFLVEDVPRLIFVAKRDIGAGEEFLYDYGDRSKQSLEAHPWLAS